MFGNVDERVVHRRGSFFQNNGMSTFRQCWSPVISLKWSCLNVSCHRSFVLGCHCFKNQVVFDSMVAFVLIH